MRLGDYKKNKFEKRIKFEVIFWFFVIIPIISIILGYVIVSMFIFPNLPK